MNILVLCDNERLWQHKDLFTSLPHGVCFTNSFDKNPKTDYEHIAKHFQLVFSWHCKTIFPKILLERVRCVNIHPGFNPYNRGVYPHIFSIVNGLPAGVTIHEMTENIDEGPIIFQSEVSITPYDTGETLYEKIIKEEILLLKSTLERVVNHHYEALPKFGGNYNSKKDFDKLCQIDFEKPGWHVYNQLRALSYSGYDNAKLNNHHLKLLVYEK